MKKIFTICTVFIATGYFVNAQNLLTNDNALITINAEMIVEGSAHNEGTVLNEGDLRLLGDWTNVGEYSSVSGTFFLSGAQQKFEPGNNNYANLKVYSTGNLTITSDLRIENSIELIYGRLDLQNGTALYLEEGATVIGGSESAYINGALYTDQQGDLLFPIGTTSAYLPVELLDVQSSEFIGVRAEPVPDDLDYLEEIDALSPNHYWEIIGNSGFSAQSIILRVSIEGFLDSEDEAIIAYTEDLGTPFQVFGQPTFIGTVASGSISTDGSILPGYYILGDKGIVDPPITVINVVTPNPDGKHDYMRIDNIQFYEDNVVEIFDRMGRKVFSLVGYNNSDQVFSGYANVNGDNLLPTGSYYFTIQLSGAKRESGFVYIKN